MKNLVGRKAYIEPWCTHVSGITYGRNDRTWSVMWCFCGTTLLFPLFPLLRTSKCHGKLNHVKKTPLAEVLALIVSIATRSKEGGKKNSWNMRLVWWASVSITFWYSEFQVDSREEGSLQSRVLCIFQAKCKEIFLCRGWCPAPNMNLCHWRWPICCSHLCQTGRGCVSA